MNAPQADGIALRRESHAKIAGLHEGWRRKLEQFVHKAGARGYLKSFISAVITLRTDFSESFVVSTAMHVVYFEEALYRN